MATAFDEILKPEKEAPAEVVQEEVKQEVSTTETKPEVVGEVEHVVSKRKEHQRREWEAQGRDPQTGQFIPKEKVEVEKPKEEAEPEPKAEVKPEPKPEPKKEELTEREKALLAEADRQRRRAQERTLRSPLMGAYNAANLLGVLGVLLASDIPLDRALATLAQLQAEVGLSTDKLRSKLAFAPRVEQLLRHFQTAAIARPRNVVHGAWLFLSLGARARWVRRRCIREFARVYRMHARAFSWDAAAQRRHLAGGRAFIEDFVQSVQRVAQFSRYERLFALWHVLHVPLVWIMLLSAIAHVVAVHAY